MSFKLVKLPFSILAVSGNDENFPADGLRSNLEWQSDRFCIFPQSIILCFDNGKCRVKKIQLLLHEYKIPREIEFLPGIMHDTGIVFKSLGFTRLDDNSMHSYKSRELKSIHVDFEATHLKISLQKNYINTLNLYNQVGIASINLLGEVMDSDYLIRTNSQRNGLQYGLVNTELDGLIKGFINHDAIDERISFVNDLSFYHMDAKMIRFISAVSDAKIEAVKLENFEVAKALKIILHNAKVVSYRYLYKASSKILKLQMEKEKFILEEDYDGAQNCKNLVEDIKLGLIDELESYGLEIDQNGVIYSKDQTDKTDSALELEKSNLTSIDSIHKSTPSIATPLVSPKRVSSPEEKQLKNSEPERAKSLPVLEDKIPPVTQESVVNYLAPLPQKNAISTRSGSPLLPAQQKLLEEGKTDIALEEKPQSPKEMKSKDLITRSGSPMLPALQKQLLKQGNNPEEEIKNLRDKGNATRTQISNAPADLNDPEPLSASQLEQFSACIDIFQLFVVQHTLSINFKSREYGLAQVSNKIAEWEKSGKSSDLSFSSLCKAATQLAGYCLEDSREKSSLLTLGVLSQLLDAASRDGGHDSQIPNSFANLLNSLVTKAGDTNPRIKSKGNDILKKLLKLYHEPPNSLLPELLKPFKDKKKGAVVHPKLLKSRLETLSLAISEYGISDRDQRFSTESIMSFVQPLIDNTNNDVRDLAYKIVAQICIQEGESYAKQYTNLMRDAQKEILLKKIASLGGTKLSGKGSIKSAKPKTKQALTSKDNNTLQKSKSKEKHESRPSSQKEESESKKSHKKDDDKTAKASKTKKASFSDDAIEAKSENDTKKTSRKSKSDSSEEECLFCERVINITSKDSLEKHYSGECPYLAECPQCGLVVEMMLLQTHMYGNCEQAPSDPKSCDRCHLLLSSADYLTHRSKKKCKIWNIDHDPSICGLCKKSIMGKSGWKVHLLTDKKCISKRNSKKKK